MTPLLAPRFLASAFASGSALLVLLILLMRRLQGFSVTGEAVHRLLSIATYCMLIHVFFELMEWFTTFYSGLPEGANHFWYLFVGVDGNQFYVPWMRISALLAVFSLAVFLAPAWRSRRALVLLACASAFVSIWLDKGLGLMVGGFVPTDLGSVATYAPNLPEWTVVTGIWAFGALLITVLYKITFSVREANATVRESENCIFAESIHH
jgi:Ni/Fe-hydrogenase subunit HybB-like protein